jgi:hypothetical protein
MLLIRLFDAQPHCLIAAGPTLKVKLQRWLGDLITGHCTLIGCLPSDTI